MLFLPAIITAAMEMLGGKEVDVQCRKPEIMADSAYAMLCRDSKSYTGNFAIDDAVLKEEGMSNFDEYAVDPKATLMPDFFLDAFWRNTFRKMCSWMKRKPAAVQGRGVF